MDDVTPGASLDPISSQSHCSAREKQEEEEEVCDCHENRGRSCTLAAAVTQARKRKREVFAGCHGGGDPIGQPGRSQ